jgi:LuxR family quorum sensing-dependent transcriptional regulator
MRRVEQRAFDTIARIKAAVRTDEIYAILRQTAGELGFSAFLLTGVPLPGEKLSQHVVMNGWSKGWMDRYNDHDYVHVDPVANEIRRSNKPFRWSDVQYDPRKHPQGHRVMLEAVDFGMSHGFTVPIYGYDGYQACVTYGGPIGGHSELDLSGLHIISLIAFSMAKDLCGAGSGSRDAEDFELTQREVQVLKWLSVGKSNWEISRILGISEGTVEKHMAGISRKMDVSNRTHAVAEALRTGIIH